MNLILRAPKVAAVARRAVQVQRCSQRQSFDSRGISLAGGMIDRVFRAPRTWPHAFRFVCVPYSSPPSAASPLYPDPRLRRDAPRGLLHARRAHRRDRPRERRLFPPNSKPRGVSVVVAPRLSPRPGLVDDGPPPSLARFCAPSPPRDDDVLERLRERRPVRFPQRRPERATLRERAKGARERVQRRRDASIAACAAGTTPLETRVVVVGPASAPAAAFVGRGRGLLRSRRGGFRPPLERREVRPREPRRPPGPRERLVADAEPRERRERARDVRVPVVESRDERGVLFARVGFTRRRVVARRLEGSSHRHPSAVAAVVATFRCLPSRSAASDPLSPRVARASLAAASSAPRRRATRPRRRPSPGEGSRRGRARRARRTRARPTKSERSSSKAAAALKEPLRLRLRRMLLRSRLRRVANAFASWRRRGRAPTPSASRARRRARRAPPRRRRGRRARPRRTARRARRRRGAFSTVVMSSLFSTRATIGEP